MTAVDTILGKVTNQVALTALTLASGDSLTVRGFQPPGKALLDNVFLKGATNPTVRITSPYLHDTTRPIQFISTQAPTVKTIPRCAPQELAPQDTLAVSAISGGADSTAVALRVYYTDLGAPGARLYGWGDVSGIIDNLKIFEVDVTASATIGAWNDLALTTTENDLRANTDYAVLGYVCDVACLAVAIRGQDTGNLRVSGPGSTLAHETSDYFVQMSNESGRPNIPVINAANVNNTTVTVADNAAGTAVKVQLVLAELSRNLG